MSKQATKTVTADEALAKLAAAHRAHERDARAQDAWADAVEGLDRDELRTYAKAVGVKNASKRTVAEVRAEVLSGI